MHDLPQWLDTLPQFEELARTLAPSGESLHARIDGLNGSAKGFVLSRLFSRLKRPLLILTYQQEQARRLWDDLLHFGVPEDRVAILPAGQSLFLEGDITDHRVIGERLQALFLLAEDAPCIVIGTLEAALQRTSHATTLLSHQFTLEANSTVDLQETTRKLVEMGYESANTVSRPGEFSRRGGILDVYPSTADAPVRIELFGDDIESIRPFDVATQRSVGRHAWVDIAPAREILLTEDNIERATHSLKTTLSQRTKTLMEEGKVNREARERLIDRVEGDLTRLQQMVYFDGLETYLPYLVPEPICALDYLSSEGVVVWDEPNQIKDHWDRITEEVHDARERHWERGETLDTEATTLPYLSGLHHLLRLPNLLLSLLGREFEDVPTKHNFTLQANPLTSYRGRLPALADDIGTWISNDCRVFLISDQPHRVREICAELNLPVQPAVKLGSKAPGLHVMEGGLRAGFTLFDLRLYLLTDAELFGSARPIVTRRNIAGGVAISSVLDLKENDYVVHIHHGIGIYRGMVKRETGGNQRDYLLIQYQGGDRLFVPADQIDRVQRYVGSDGTPPTINKIGGNEWQRTTRKVREQAREIARELIQLYAAREAATRLSFGEDTPWQMEMEEAFPYEETPDQLRAINDVKGDLEGEKPMDRLICGDVGFGKTEVALRAAFKVVAAGKQVAVLCPTTVLAAQHLTTFTERFAAYPMQIDLLSRFRNRQQQAETLRGLEAGTVDVVVGTHRLLSKDIKFHNLGLVIVDEEQRFGVQHKERLKQLRTQVDVLTLSATPIPRTLSMSLSGLRDMSVIENPPEGRIPILTYVREYDSELIRDAILRERERDGQIYFVHNRVESIYHVAEHLQKLIPDIRIEVGHGQMSEEELERVMFNFYHHKHDILLCTTIIENGLDVGNANTIIIDNADHLGLSQLYQLRGRVGRSNRQAYCYLFYRKHKKLSEEAEQRLAAMREFSALGSGFKVAMRDLEIRGAGNLLGAEQSGAMINVGFDLYCQLLAQAVQELKGEEVTEDILPSIDLPLTIHIPPDYIPGEAERIYFYKRMSGVRSVGDVENLQAELEDRFGDPPKPVWDALAVLRLRLRCKEAGIASVKTEGAQIHIRFAPQARLTPEAIRLLMTAFKGHRFTPEGVVVPMKSAKVMPQIEETITVLEKALAYGKGSAKTGKQAT
jgi:transcription-repair coupling factor (superfamily II helicase)